MVHVLLLAVFDVFALYEAFVLAFSIRASDPKPLAHYMTIEHFGVLAVALAPLWITIFGVSGLYAVRERRGATSELGRVVVGVSCGVMALAVLDYLRATSPIFPGRSVPIYALLLGIVFVFLSRQIVRLMLRVGYAHGRGRRNVVLIGTGPLARRIAGELQRPSQGYRVVAVVDPQCDGARFFHQIPVHSTLESALTSIAVHVDEVMQADTDISRADIARLMAATTSRGITYRFVPDHYGIYAAASKLTTIDAIPVMEVRLTALDGWGAVTKRAFDIVGSLLLLGVLSPLIALVALAVRVSDRSGPVFYRQERLGRGGIPIQILKFRTMSWCWSTGPGRPFRSEAEAFLSMGRPDLADEFRKSQKVVDDPRVSRFGHWLRRTSLDELPQLFSALTGGLSLIGPRPITCEELERYGSQTASFMALKPGITGLWQISGRNDVTYEERVKLDIFYVENWSLRLDMNILARTTGAVLSKRGAY